MPSEVTLLGARSTDGIDQPQPQVSGRARGESIKARFFLFEFPRRETSHAPRSFDPVMTLRARCEISLTDARRRWPHLNGSIPI